ncbi:MAG: DUF2461 domain-containing protein [Bacteroidales bacterium]|nr:DUF2461 domain-containing protein [Bacteroidales bacterium]
MKGTIHPDTLQFFNELSVNNNREWFMDNKSRWEAIREQFMAFTAAVIEVMTPLDPTLGDITAKGCLYRINRDIRFSPDKRPYKTHIAFFLPTGGNRRCAVPGYYMQLGIEDYGLHGNCALGGGIFMPEPAALAAIRQEIFYNTDEFLDIINNKDYKRYFGTTFLTQKVLTRVPKDYPADWQHADLLKYKDYCSMHSVPDELLFTDKLFDHVVRAFRATVPLNKFIIRAMYEIL